jgi:signal transduction histidine kinase
VTLVVAGLAGSLGEAVVNKALLTTVKYLAREPSTLMGTVRNFIQSVPIVLPFGITAAGATILYRVEGTWGIVTLLLPLAIVQASMVALARRAHTQAEAQKREAQAQRREARALRRAADASEGERKRIAGDLHDSVIQDVTGLFISSSALERRLVEGEEAAWDRENILRFIRAGKDMAAGAVRELRTLMVELAPPLLDEEGLASALRQLLTRLDQEGISWSLDCTEASFDKRQQRLAYRLVQEALRNIVKHAQCQSAWVVVRVAGEMLLVSVRDDGRGFSASERAQRRRGGHNGLGMLADAMRDGGGVLTVKSAPGAGTTLLLSLPLIHDGVDEVAGPAGGVPDAATGKGRVGVSRRRGTRPAKDGAAVPSR